MSDVIFRYHCVTTICFCSVRVKDGQSRCELQHVKSATHLTHFSPSIKALPIFRRPDCEHSLHCKLSLLPTVVNNILMMKQSVLIALLVTTARAFAPLSTPATGVDVRSTAVETESSSTWHIPQHLF